MSSTKRPCPIFRPAEPVKKNRKNKVINEKWSKMQRDADICLGRVQDIMEEQRARIEYLEARNSELVEENIRLKQQGAKLNHQQVYKEATKALDSGFCTDSARQSLFETFSSLIDFPLDINKTFSLDDNVKMDSGIYPLTNDQDLVCSSKCDISLDKNPKKEDIVIKSDKSTKSSSLDLNSSLPNNESTKSSSLDVNSSMPTNESSLHVKSSLPTNESTKSSSLDVNSSLPTNGKTKLSSLDVKSRLPTNLLNSDLILHGGLQNFGTDTTDDSSNGRGLPGSSETTSFLEKMQQERRFEFNPMLAATKQKSAGSNLKLETPKPEAKVKPYECQYCHSRFTRSNNLRRHERSRCPANPNKTKS